MEGIGDPDTLANIASVRFSAKSVPKKKRFRQQQNRDNQGATDEKLFNRTCERSDINWLH